MPESIERTEVDGRPATVIYLNADFEPATPDDHTMVKIIWDDGDIAFASKAKGPEDEDEPEDDDE